MRAILSGLVLALVVAVAAVVRRDRQSDASVEDAALSSAALYVDAEGRQRRLETVASGLTTVWDLALAPDSAIWFTERGGKVSRLDPERRQLQRIGEIEVTERSESGLMGMAFHPDFPREPFLYLVHSYQSVRGIRNRLVRVRITDSTLGAPEVLLDGLDGAGNHNGARIAIGPDRHLYLSMGDAGDRSISQDSTALNGKILRLTLDGRAAPDNPFGNEVWSWGHRNVQGLAFHPRTGILYASDHGPHIEDEVNLIERGRNYGWPEVNGRCDEPDERDFCRRQNVAEPLHSWTPTVGVAGIAVYDEGGFEGWRGSLLVAALRGTALYRLTLSRDGRRVRSSERLLAGELGRLRDVLVAPDGSIYLATSNRDGRGSPEPEDDRIVRLSP